jgi:hypothetical protein
MLSPSERLLVRCAQGLCLTGLLVYCAVVYPWLLHHVLLLLSYNDFGKFYYSLQQWQGAGTLYGPSPATAIAFEGGRIVQFWNMNPPHFHLLIWPLVYLPISGAFWLWMAINVAAAGWAIWRIGHAHGRHLGLTGFILTLASAPMLTWFVTGQVTGLLMALVTAIWLEARRGRWVRAGVLIGVAVSLKMFLWPLGAYLLLRRAWGGVASACAAGAGAFIVGLTMFGVQAHRDWLQALRDVQWTGAVMNASVYGLISRTWTIDVSGTPSALALSSAVALVVVAIGLWAAASAETTDDGMALVLTSALLASPLGWIYYLPIVAGPLLARRHALQPVAIGLCLIPFFLLYPFSTRVFAMTAGSTMTWALISVWLSVLSIRWTVPTLQHDPAIGAKLTPASHLAGP